MRCWRVGTASTTPTCCAAGRPPPCWATVLGHRAGPPCWATVLGHRVMAPSTLGTFLRSFTFGHVRQLDRLGEQILTRAWAAGAGPGDGPMTIDLDSTVCPVHGYHKQGAAYGYTHTLGYHPLVATRADSGEVLHARQRAGRANTARGTARGTARFVDELAARVRRAGATGELTMRADSGFWSAKTIRACRRHRIRYSITVRQTKPIRQAIATIPADAWTDIVYPDTGLAQVAETRYKGDRLIVPRRAPHPPGRPAGRAVCQLALPRLGHRPGRHHRLARPRSPPPRRGGAVHPRPQSRSGPAAPSLGQVRRQRPMPPGFRSPPWRTTCCAGSPPSDWEHAKSWWWPRRCAGPCSACPAG
jgi:DDE family transposase